MSVQFLIILIITLFFFNNSFIAAYDRSYNVVDDFGATADGISDCTKSFLNAWGAACNNATENVTIYVPPGKYFLTRTVFYGQHCKNEAITFLINGTLLAPSDYNVTANFYTWLAFSQVTGLTILGGTLDGRGASLWACKKSNNSINCPHGATSLGIYQSKGVTINGLASLNSQMFHILVYGCVNVDLIDINIVAPWNSINTDGIHLQRSSGVNIWNSVIGTGDDCISMGEGTTNVLIEQVLCGPGHGISIGSLARVVNEQGVQNVTVNNATFIGTQNGVRIKAWANPSNAFVRNVIFKDISVVKAQNPIIIDTNYCTRSNKCPTKGSSGVKISNITFQHIHGTSATMTAVKLDCSKIYPCVNITLDGVDLTYNDKQAIAYCSNASGFVSNGVTPLPINCFSS